MKVLLDMDGVLVDFFGGVARTLNVSVKPWPVLGCNWFSKAFPEFTDKQVYDAIRGKEWWANLNPLPYADKIVDGCIERVGIENVAFLTKPVQDPGCLHGKM